MTLTWCARLFSYLHNNKPSNNTGMDMKAEDNATYPCTINSFPYVVFLYGNKPNLPINTLILVIPCMDRAKANKNINFMFLFFLLFLFSFFGLILFILFDIFRLLTP